MGVGGTELRHGRPEVTSGAFCAPGSCCFGRSPSQGTDWLPPISSACADQSIAAIWLASQHAVACCWESHVVVGLYEGGQEPVHRGEAREQVWCNRRGAPASFAGSRELSPAAQASAQRLALRVSFIPRPASARTAFPWLQPWRHAQRRAGSRALLSPAVSQ